MIHPLIKNTKNKQQTQNAQRVTHTKENDCRFAPRRSVAVS